ncbi:DUF262 domain-containing HNH endonuclease family protein [Nostoc sp. UHCC 0251]|uniref:DUF262 domain-containing protein n=1 Tax=Nostoc sp. UHCC 0251 TaxID=3110240 RepID=UPI002B1F8615|nr:DUF262 domain-containing HNH endonuclease family protein [Nostoc sp. UHCC 0251]MEA5624304.1 DUF262 domain-containing HNH endonuclease family protein [Nostoc sp. UHCC 0251]
MARINLLDTRSTSFGDLLSNGRAYRVPPFQRDYSWEEENWEDLWQDIWALHNNPDSSHFMGAIVLQNSGTSDKEFIIIDGQQRLATLSIVVIAIIEKLQELVKQEKDIEANQERQEILRRTYLSDRDPRSLRYSSKLILNDNNNDFYQSNLINLRKSRNFRSIVKSNQLLWQAFQYFLRCLEKQEIANNGKSLVEIVTDSISQRLLFVQINVEDELKAYSIFETLNTRGVTLSTTDILTNYIFSLFQGKTDLEIAQYQWRKVINTIQRENFTEFLRYFFGAKEKNIRGDKLFRLVQKNVKTSQQAFNLLEQLEDYSGLFIALNNYNDDFWRDASENRPYIRELELFQVKQAYPILFTAYERFSFENFTRLLKLVCVISFRYTIVCSLNPNKLETLYSKLAILITNGEITNPKQVFDSLRSVYVSDEKFLQDFSLLSIPTKGQKKKLVRYILCKLEADASHIDVNEDSFSIEHILPESPNSDWQQNFTDAQIEEMVYRIGNLTLLEPNLNREVGNKLYPIKRKVYQQSVYKLTQNILAEQWTPNTLSTRQRFFAQRAVHIWRSDFPL